MRHHKKGRKLHRKKGQRQALFKSLINNLVVYEKIETTEAKAKEIKPMVEKMITMAKKQNLPSLRIILSKLSKKPAQKLYYEIAPGYLERKGGYTRVIKGVKARKKDGSKMAIIEFV